MFLTEWCKVQCVTVCLVAFPIEFAISQMLIMLSEIIFKRQHCCINANKTPRKCQKRTAARRLVVVKWQTGWRKRRPYPHRPFEKGPA